MTDYFDEMNKAAAKLAEHQASLKVRAAETGDNNHPFAGSPATSTSLPSEPVPMLPDNTPLPIRKFLDISTAHVSRATADKMDAGETVGVTYYKLSYGWLVYVSDPEHEDPTDPIPEELARALTLARANNCDYIMFDADAERIHQLPEFEW